MSVHVLNIGYGRHLFDASNDERERLRRCAEEVSSFHYIVFSRRTDGKASVGVSKKFFLYPTNSRLRLLMVADAFLVGRRIVRASPRGTDWCVTSQDPLGAGIAGYLLARWMGCPFVVQEHGDIFSGNYWRSESWKNRIWYPVASFLVRHADRVRVVGARVLSHIASRGVPQERFRTLPVFSDTRRFSLSTPQRNLRAEYPRASCVVLSLARFVPQKNILLLVRAFARSLREDSRLQLVLVGRGPEQGRIEREIRALNIASNVTLMPWSDDAISLMKTADIYALSSNYEGWGRVLIEAMASGLPAVTTEVGCVGEVFMDGEHGVVVPVGDEVRFAAALSLLSAERDRRQRYSENGTRDTAGIFRSLDEYAKKWAEVFTQ